MNSENGCYFATEDTLTDCLTVYGGVMKKGIHGAIKKYVQLAQNLAVNYADTFGSGATMNVSGRLQVVCAVGGIA